MSQVANTFWDDAVERTGAGVRVRPRVKDAAKVRPRAKQRFRAQHLVDGVILTILLAAAAMCVSSYSGARAELGVALAKHSAASEKVQDLTISVEKLERDIQQLRTDSRVIEHVARQKFGFIRSGDVVIKLAQDQKDAGTDTRPVKVATLTPRSSDGYADTSN